MTEGAGLPPRCGIDTVAIARIERLLRETPEEDLRSLFSPAELGDSGEGPGRAASLAARFAAKEAFSKALGTGIHFPVNWHNVWVENARSGKPSLKFSRPLARLLKQRGIANVYVSITDETGMACAFVVVEGAAPKPRRKG